MIKIIVIIILGYIIYYMLINRQHNLKVKEVKEVKEEFNLNCILKDSNNIAKDYDSAFFEKKSLLDQHVKDLNSVKIPENIYSSKMLIPFNYKDKLDNNIIYNLNTKKRESILKNEKKYYNKIQPFNQRILTSGYNKNLNGFLKDHETPIEYKRNCKNYQLFGSELCNKDNIKVNLYGTFKDNKIHLYWNLPANCINIENIYLFYKETDYPDSDYEALELKYIDDSLTKKYKNVGKLDAYYNIDRLNYNFYFKYPDKYDAFIYVKLFNNEEIFSNVFKHYDVIKN